MKMWIKISLAILVLLVAYIGYETARMYRLSGRGNKLFDQVPKFERQVENPEMRILVLGDSTGVGTGVTDSLYSVAGRLGQDFPEAEIINRAEVGMKTAELKRRLPELLAEEHRYDLVVVHIGANDAIRMKNLNQTQRNLGAIMAKLSQRSRQVAHYTSGKIGKAPFFPWFLDPLLTSRAMDLRAKAMEVDSGFENVHYVDLIEESGQDIFARDPDRFYAIDFLHPSNEGYKHWYLELKEVLEEETDLYPEAEAEEDPESG